MCSASCPVVPEPPRKHRRPHRACIEGRCVDCINSRLERSETSRESRQADSRCAGGASEAGRDNGGTRCNRPIFAGQARRAIGASDGLRLSPHCAHQRQRRNRARHSERPPNRRRRHREAGCHGGKGRIYRRRCAQRGRRSGQRHRAPSGGLRGGGVRGRARCCTSAYA